MIIGDTNRNLLISADTIIICRENSIITYNNDYTKKYNQTLYGLPRSFGNKAYDYSNNRILSIQKQEHREYNVGDVIDYFKCGNEFLFIKQNNVGGKVQQMKFKLIDKDNKTISTFYSLYQYVNNSLFYIDKNEMLRLDIETRQSSVLHKINNKVVCFTVQMEGIDEKSLYLAYADLSNKVHIVHDGNTKVYHWCSNKILKLLFYDTYVIAAAKNGDIVMFHLHIEKIETLIKFNGIFLDMLIKDTKLYVLTNIEFLVFDLTTSSLDYRDIIVPKANFQVTNVKEFACNEENDIFKMKRKTRIEIHNELKNSIKEQTMINNRAIAYISNEDCFLYDITEKMNVSMFKLDGQTCLVSDEHVFVLSHRKSNYIVNVFDLYKDRLVLNTIREINTKVKLEIENMWFIKEKLYIKKANGIFVLSNLKVLEMLCVCTADSIIRKIGDVIYCSDQNGLFNTMTKQYAYKQKMLKNFSQIDKRIAMYIQGKGVYIDMPERTQVIEINNVIDMDAEKDENGNESLNILFQHDDGKVKLRIYKKIENESGISFELCDERIVSTLSNRILSKSMFVSKTSLLLGE